MSANEKFWNCDSVSGDGNARTLEEVGQQFRVTRERIRQIEAKALRKMRPSHAYPAVERAFWK